MSPLSHATRHRNRSNPIVLDLIRSGETEFSGHVAFPCPILIFVWTARRFLVRYKVQIESKPTDDRLAYNLRLSIWYMISGIWLRYISRVNSEKPSFFLEYFFGIKIHQQIQKITLNLMMLKFSENSNGLRFQKNFEKY